MQYNLLKSLYIDKRFSVSKIAGLNNCSENKVNYWLAKHKINKRSISEAIYLKHNPKGDPFLVKEPKNLDEMLLFGIGLGLYWGEGTKSNKHAIRLGNTNPAIIRTFIEFLTKIYGINQSKLRYGLQIFSDTQPSKALNFWVKELKAKPGQFQKIIITPARGVGNYKNKANYGVLTVYYHNKKLRDILNQALEKF